MALKSFYGQQRRETDNTHRCISARCYFTRFVVFAIMDAMSLHVLYEDNHLLVVHKPPGLPTMGVKPEIPSLLAVAKRYIKEKYAKPGNVYLGVVSRLDTPVSGVVVMARTSKAAARLNEQFRERLVAKTYWALVEGHLREREQELVDWLGEDPRHRRVAVVPQGTAGAREARLRCYRLQRCRRGSLVEVELLTGRKHQIRVQLASRGYPILGDRKYGSRAQFGEGIALLAKTLRIMHPVTREPLEFSVRPPAAWRAEGVPEEVEERRGFFRGPQF